MRKYSILFAVAALAASTGIAAAQNQMPASKHKQQPMTTGQGDPARGTGFTGAPSTTNPKAGGGYQSPREIPENGGATNKTNRRR